MAFRKWYFTNCILFLWKEISSLPCFAQQMSLCIHINIQAWLRHKMRQMCKLISNT